MSDEARSAARELEWKLCAFGCGSNVCHNPSWPDARQGVKNHVCAGRMASWLKSNNPYLRHAANIAGFRPKVNHGK